MPCYFIFFVNIPKKLSIVCSGNYLGNILYKYRQIDWYLGIKKSKWIQRDYSDSRNFIAYINAYVTFLASVGTL
jgi:hypothetical protein